MDYIEGYPKENDLRIPDGLEWNGKEEGFFVEWLSYFVLFTDRFSFAIQALTPTLFCRRQNWVNRYIEGYPKENDLRILYWIFIEGYPKENF